MTAPKIYLLAGLGFDYRLFSQLEIKYGEINYINWLEPVKDELFLNYVRRMADQIVESNFPIILIGHSFGGIIIQEISKIIKTNKVIVISSIKDRNEMSFILKSFNVLPVYKLLNKKTILKSFPLWARIFGYNSEKGRLLFNQMISNSTDNYLQWSLENIAAWQGNNNSQKVIHIHGSNDKTFSYKKIKDPIIVPNGSHFMVFSKADEVSDILNKIIAKD